jgi:LCP family protein required for cell wall assembly
MDDGRPENWFREGRVEHVAAGAPATAPQYGGGQFGPTGTPVKRKRRRWPQVLLGLVVVLAIVIVGGYFYLDSRLKRENALADYSGRPADTPGTNWLIVGSDSREGLSKQQRKAYATGTAAGRRTDSMMLMHTGSGGTTLVSLPRDSYVPIAGHGSNKLNAAFAFGGPQLLVRTVEQATGVHIDHYAEVGFGGFVGVVDAVGGVRLCIKEPMKDHKAGLNLKKGCQTLNGGQALGYVRTRASARADLDRVARQRQFFSALISKATSPGVLLNPFRSVPMALHATDNFSVDQRDGLTDLVGLMWSMKGVGSGDGVTTTVPVGGFGSSPAAGSYLIWDRTKATELFNALKTDTKVPKDAISR